jgi:cell division control protein 6
VIEIPLFKDMLGNEETLFKDTVALDFDFVPKIVPYREFQQRYMAACIKPLFQDMNGKNLVITGPPGVGKTVACKHVLRELEDETDDIVPLYINCWQKNTSFKVILELCDLLNYKFTQNRKTDELFNVVKQMLNKKSAVFVFDEVDKLEDYDFLYSILEEIYKKSIFLITNYKEWIVDMDERIKSRLTPDSIEFKPYNYDETKGILKQRLVYAFQDDVWDDAAFEMVARKTFEIKDLRSGLKLMKEAGDAAEEKAARKILPEHVKTAFSKLEDFTIKKSTDLAEDTRLILNIIKEHSGSKIGDLYKSYKNKGGEATYKTFTRKIAQLEKSKFIVVTKTSGGKEGNTSIVEFIGEKIKRLTDF